MLAYLTRVVPVLLRAQIGSDGRLVSRITRRVRLSDIDTNLHMNQAVYAQVGELGRADWALRSGAWKAWRAIGVYPVVADQKITYRRELRTFARYAVETRAVAVEGRLLRFEGHLVVGEQVHAIVEASLIFIGPDGVLTPERASEVCAAYLVERLAVEDWRVSA